MKRRYTGHMYLLKLIILILILAAIYTAIRTTILIKKSSALIAASSKYERISPRPSHNLLFLGDSTTVGTGSENPELSVAGRFGAAYPNASIYNRGINGQKIHELVQSFVADPLNSASGANATSSTSPLADSLVAPQGPAHFDLIVIQIGANDIIRFTPTDKIEADLDTLLAEAKTKSDRVAILHSGNLGLSPFFPRYLGWIWTMRTKQVRSIYIRLADKHQAMYVDLFEEKNSDELSKDPKKYYAADYLHLTGAGYGIWFDKINAAIEASGMRAL